MDQRKGGPRPANNGEAGSSALRAYCVKMKIRLSFYVTNRLGESVWFQFAVVRQRCCRCRAESAPMPSPQGGGWGVCFLTSREGEHGYHSEEDLKRHRRRIGGHSSKRCCPLSLCEEHREGSRKRHDQGGNSAFPKRHDRNYRNLAT